MTTVALASDIEKHVAATIAAAVIQTNPGLLNDQRPGTTEDKAVEVYLNCLTSIEKSRGHR